MSEINNEVFSKENNSAKVIAKREKFNKKILKTLQKNYVKST